jgi:hypothetical protein
MIILGRSTGMEHIGRAVLMHLQPSLNTEIHAQSSIWAPLDQAFATQFGVIYTPVVLEDVESHNMHMGHIPSLIEAPLDQYPNLCAMSAEMASVEESYDQGDEFSYGVYIEIMVKSLVSQEDVNKRIQRTTDAVHSLLLGERTIGGNFTEFELRSGDVSDVFVRREEKSREARWFWQGSRLDYSVKIPASY